MQGTVNLHSTIQLLTGRFRVHACHHVQESDGPEGPEQDERGEVEAAGVLSRATPDRIHVIIQGAIV